MVFLAGYASRNLRHRSVSVVVYIIYVFGIFILRPFSVTYLCLNTKRAIHLNLKKVTKTNYTDRQPLFYDAISEQIWNEAEHPWIDLVRIQLTTTIPLTALSRTYFNIVDKPACLRFPAATSVHDYRSYQYVCSGMYTRFEIDHLGTSSWRGDETLEKEVCRRGKVHHYVTLSTAPVRDTKSRVDVYITLIGERGLFTLLYKSIY